MLRVDHIGTIHVIPLSVQRVLLRETFSSSRWKSCKKSLLPKVSCLEKGNWQAITVNRIKLAGALLRRYQARSPRMVAWARATFEQGALPSLLFLQGLVPVFTLPGDKMFQATGLNSHKQRPPIMHVYGGAKSGMAQALQSIASEGWIPLAAAMVGTIGKPPLCVKNRFLRCSSLL